MQTLLTLCNKEVEHGKDHRVATEHVVTTCMYSCQGHPKTAPDGHSALQFGPHVTVYLEGERERNETIILRSFQKEAQLNCFQKASSVTFPEHCRCCPGTDRDVTNMVTQRSMNTVPIRLHMRRKRMDLQVIKNSESTGSVSTFTCTLVSHKFSKYGKIQNLIKVM